MAKYEDELVLKDKVSDTLRKINRKFADLNKVSAKATERIKQFRLATEKLKTTGRNLTEFGQKLTVGITLPIIAAGGAMIKLASDMEETLNKVDVSFGASSDDVKEWAKTSIRSMGLAQQSALDSAALYGDMATGMGMSQKQASKMAMSLTQLGADLASFKNISNDVAQTALKSIFTGETESLKNLGIVMTETNLQQYAYSKGIRKKIKDMTELEKIQIRYNYVMSKTKNAQGDFIRTGGGAANQTRMFQENLKELGVTFGTYILPYFTAAIKKLNGILIKFGELSPRTQKMILLFGGIAAAIGPLIIGIGGLVTAIGALGTALTFLLEHPVILTIVGWTAVFAAIASGIYNVVKAVKTLIEYLGHLRRMKIPTINLENQDNLAYLSQKQMEMGDKAFTKKYGKEVAKSVTNYRQSNVQTSNKTTNNNFYGDIKSTGTGNLDFILNGGYRVPLGA